MEIRFNIIVNINF